MTRRLRRWILLPALCLGACSIPKTIEQLDESCPPPELGRPGWVRGVAQVGSWVGGAVGGVGSIVLLPITWPLSELSDDQLEDQAQDELLWFPATGLAALGHAALGAPADGLDYVFRRAWFAAPSEETDFDATPLAAPAQPQVVEADAMDEADG